MVAPAWRGAKSGRRGRGKGAKTTAKKNNTPQEDKGATQGRQEELGKPTEEDYGPSDAWTPKKEDKLVDMYEACKFLYNKALPEYRLRHKKVKAFFADNWNWALHVSMIWNKVVEKRNISKKRGKIREVK